MSANEARRELAKLANGESNWRLAGLMLAHPRVPSGLSESDVAKAWPVHKSEYRKLGIDQKDDPGLGPGKSYAFDEESDAYRELSGVVEESAFSDEGPFESKKIHSDRAIKRALAFEDSIANLDTLFREEIRETVIQGARKAQIARDATTVINVDRQRGDHPRGQCENALNRAFITELVDNAGSSVDASSENNRGVAAINAGIEQVELNDFMPDTVVQHPKFTKTLFDTAESNAIIPFANEFGDDEGIRDRVAFPLLGLEGFRASNGMYDPAGSNTWDYDGNDETGAVVYDRDNIATYLFRDVEMKEYDDPIRDLSGINARIEFDVKYHQPDSAAEILYGTS